MSTLKGESEAPAVAGWVRMLNIWLHCSHSARPTVCSLLACLLPGCQLYQPHSLLNRQTAHDVITDAVSYQDLMSQPLGPSDFASADLFPHPVNTALIIRRHFAIQYSLFKFLI